MREMVFEHAKSGKGEAGEDTDRVQPHQRVELRLEHDDEQNRHGSEHEDAVGEDQAVAALGQLPRQERIARDEAGEVWETVEARVPTGEEDEHGGGLDDKERDCPEPGGTENIP